MILLINLLKSGLAPNLVIFMDGVNCGTPKDLPHFTHKIERIFHDKQFAPPFHEFLFHYLKWILMIRFANSSNHKFAGQTKRQTKMDEPEDVQVYAKQIMNQFHANWNIAARISEMYESRVFFFLQPNAWYNYPTELYRISLSEQAQKNRHFHQEFYNQMKTTDGFIDLSGLFEVWGHHRKAIVDDVHYSPNFNRFLAQQVADRIDLASLVTRPLESDDSESIGSAKRLGVLAPESPIRTIK